MKDLTARFHALVLPLLFFSASLFAQNKALDLSAVGNRIDVTHNLNISGFTVEQWVYVNNLSQTHGLINQTTNNLPSPLDVYVTPAGDLSVLFGNNSNIGVGTHYNGITANDWTHIAISYDPASTGTEGKVYVNGIQVTTYSVSGIGNGSNPIMIGNRHDNATEADILVDEVRIWNSPRTGTAIASDYYRTLTGSEPNLQVYMGFENTLDDSATGDGSQNGSLSAGSIDYVTGPHLNSFALDFDGADDYVNLGTSFNSVLAGTNQLTVEAWVYRTSSKAFHTLIGNYVTGSVQFLLRLDNDKPTFWISDTGTPSLNAIGATSVPLNTWTHVAGTYDGSTIKVYVDGVLDGSTAMTGNFVSVGSSVAISGNPGAPAGELMQGQIDEVRVWTTARSDSQIAGFKDVELTGNEPELLAYYDFSSGPNMSVVSDITGNGYNGVLANMDAANDWVVSAHGVAQSNSLDSTSPTPTISSGTTDITGLNPFSITISFDEEVTGFDLADITVSNGIPSNLQTSDGVMFTADITPISAVGLTIDVVAGTVTDLTGNPNVASNQWAVGFIYNTVSIVGLPGGPHYLTYQPAFGAWEVVVEAPASSTFSYRINDDPTMDFGDNLSFDGVPDLGGTSIFLLNTGIYTINFGANVDWYGAEEIVTLGIIGDALPNGWGDPDIDLIYQGSGVYTIDNLTFTTGEWKVRANDAWDRSWGDDPVADGILDQTGANISVTEGNYDVSIDLINRTYFLSANPPPAPTDLIAYRSAIDQIQLEWADVVGETGYLIERASDYAFTAGIQTVDNVSANTTFYQHNIGGDQGYFYRITATNGVEDASSQSSVEYATTEAFPGYALTFNGGGDYATAGTAGAINVTGSYTVEAWVNPASTAAMVIFSTRTSVTDFGFDMQLADGNTIHGDIGDGVNWITNFADASYSYNTGEWIHVAYSITSSGYTIYVDGNVVGSGGYSATPVLLDATHDFMTIGAENNAGGTYFNGSVDEVRVWNYAKTDFSDRNGPLLGNEAGLVAYYAFDENTGLKAVDRSANTNDANLAGGPIWMASQFIQDTTPPTVISITRQVPTNEVAGANVSFRVTFDEDVAGVNTADFQLNTIGGTVAGTVSNVSQVSASVYDVIVFGLTGNGPLELVFDGGQDIADMSGNLFNGTAISTSESYIIDTASPIANLTRSNPVSETTDLSEVTFLLVFDENVLSVSIDDFVVVTTGSVTGTVSGFSPMSNIMYQVTVNGISGNGTLGVGFNGSQNIEDFVGNLYDGVSVGDNELYQIQQGGLINPALNMTGGTEFVSINDSPSFDQDTDWTIEAWIKTPNTGQENIISQYNGSNGYAFFKIGSTIYFQYFSGAAYQNGAASMAVTTGIDDNNWHHVAVSQSGANGKMYVDGSLVFDFNGMMSLDEPTADIRFGNNAGIGAFTGSIDEVRFWNYQRTDQEIIDNYNAQMEGNESGLVAYYSFIEAGGLSVGDYTINGNTGSLFNSPTWVEGPILFPSGGSAPQIFNFGIVDFAATTATVSVNVDISSVLYYVVTGSNTPPSDAQIQNGLDDLGNPALFSGNIGLAPGFSDFGLSSLDPETNYFVYAVAEAGGSFSNIVSSNFTTLGDPVITVNSPDGGENIEQNSVYQITWVANDFVGDPLLVVEYSDNGGISNWFPLITDNASILNGSYFWYVDEAIHSTSADYKIRVRTNDLSVSDESNNVFSIVASGAPSFTLLFPNGGEQFERGQSIEINYLASGFSLTDEIFFDYSSNGGTDWSIIGSTNLGDNPGIFYFNLDPLSVPVSSNYKIRVRNFDNSTFDESNNPFNVISEPPPAININNPGQGQQIEQNTIIPIGLFFSNFYDGLTTIVLEVSSNNGTNWTEIAQRPLETLYNGFNWLVSSATYSTGTNYLIRARTTDNAVIGTMPGTFEVVAPFSAPSIVITEPQPNQYRRGDNVFVRFNTTGIPATNLIEIAYSIDGVNYTPIIQDALSNIPGEYNWFVDNIYPESSNYTLRIRDLGGTGEQGFSQVFEIAVPPKVTITSQAVAGGAVSQGETARLIYQFSAQIEDKDLITEGIVLAFDGDIQPADLDAIGLWINNVDDFGNASLYSLAEYPNVSFPEFEGNSFLWFFNEFYTTGTTLYYYVTVDVALGATEGVSFSIVQPTSENFGFGDDTNVIVNAQASNNFSINAAIPTIKVTAPNVEENFTVGDNMQIVWEQSGFPGADLMEVRLSTNGGSSYSAIGSNTADGFNGQFSWVVPNLPSTQCLIQVANITTEVSDESDALFTITAPTILAPTVQARNVEFPSVGIDVASIRSFRGNGDGRIILVREGVSAFPTPMEDVFYNASNQFGVEDFVGDNWFVVYSGIDSTVNVTGLKPLTTYAVAVFDYNTNGVDQIKYNLLTATGNPSQFQTFALPNVSLHFDGVDDYVEIPNNSFLDLGNTFSIEAFVKSGGANSGSRTIIDKRNAGTNNSNFTLSVVNGTGVGIYINNGTTNFSQTVPDALQVGTWALLTVTYDGTNVRVYVNGIEQAVFPLTMTYVNQAVPIQIGRTSTNSEFFNGEIDEVRIWTNVLTPQNIGYNTTKELISNEFGLVAYYKFNDGIPGSNNTAIASVSNFAAASVAQPIDGVLNGFAKTGPTSNFVESTAFDLNVIRPNGQANTINISGIATTTSNIAWTNGNGVKRIVAIRLFSLDNMPDLQDNVYYNADARYGRGDQTSDGWYIVYNGVGNNVTVTDLSPNTQYKVAVIEANGPAGAELYFLNTATGNPNSFTTSQITPNVVITTIPVAGANIRQGKSDALVYKFKMEVTAAPVDLASLALNFTGSATNTEFVNGGLKLFASVTGDNITNFTTAIPVATSSYNSGTPLWFVNRNYPAGTTIHFYVTASAAFGATATRTFSASTPIAGNFSYSSSPTPNMNFTAAGSGNTFTFEQTPSVTLTSEIDATVMRKRIVPSSTNNWVYKYNLVIDRDVRVTKIRIPFDGTLTTADVSANGAKLWVNTNPGITTPPTGSPIATASVGVSEIVFDIPTNDQLFSGANTIQFWVSLDVAASARLDNTFQGVGTSNDFTFNDIVLLFDSPSIGQKATITAADTYCDPAENPISTTVGPLITNFTMPGISNSPQGEQDYHMFYLFNSAGVLSNTNQNVSITSSGNGFVKMWADWDKNNSFNETTELVVNNVPISAGVPMNTIISVPASVTAGNSRIRVYVYETNEWINGGCDPLNGGITTAEGQIHDYGISIVEPNGATQTLAASNVGYFNFTANWIAMPGANFYRLDIAEDAAFTKLLVNNEGVTTNSYTLNTNLKYDKPYYYRVRVAYPSNTTGNSNITSLRTQRDPLTAQDSVALVLLHQTNGGSGWANATNWRQSGKRLETWEGVTMTGTRVTGLNMEGFGMTGDLPAQFGNSGALQMMTNWNLASNDLTGIQAAGGLSALANLNVVENKLVFEDLWDFVGAFDTFNYSPQQELGEATEVVIPRGSNHTVNFIEQQAETYQWKRNGIDIPSATSTNYLIEDIKYESMGDFVLDMTDGSVPGLTLSSAPQTVLASGGITLNVSNLIGLPLDEGTGYLLKIEQPGEPFDTTQVVNFNDGYLFFDITILGDYIISVHSDPSIYLPTYYAQTFLWEEADTLFFRNVALQANMVMTSIPGALDPLDQGLISGFFDIEDPNIPDGRVEGRRRGSNVRCHIRRNTGGGRTEADNYVLIASVETDENGQFNISNLPPGLYRINFEYPGVPMDQNSFVEFEVTADGDNSEINLAALAENGLIGVEQILPTGIGKILEEMKVYPIPATNVLHIEFKDLKVNATASLWNMEGRNVKEAMLVKSNTGNHDLDLSDLSGGLYILNVVNASTGKLLTSFKVLIRK